MRIESEVPCPLLLSSAFDSEIYLQSDALTDVRNLSYATDIFTHDVSCVEQVKDSDSNPGEVYHKQLINQKELVLQAISDPAYCMKSIRFISEELKKDKDIALAGVNRSGCFLNYVSEELKNDKEVVLAALKNGYSFHEINENLRNNKDIVIGLINSSFPKKLPYLIPYVSEELRNDKEVVLAAVTNLGSSLQYASIELRNDKEVVLAAVTNSGASLQYANINLKNDKEVVLAAKSKVNF